MWFKGPLALSGSIATGSAVLAAQAQPPLPSPPPSLHPQACVSHASLQAMGADFGYIGSAFIATHEARATEAYKAAVVACSSDDIVYSNLFTGVHGNYLAPSITSAGLDPNNLPSRCEQENKRIRE